MLQESASKIKPATLRTHVCLIALLLLCTPASASLQADSAAAQQAPAERGQTVTVGVYPSPPFVMQDDAGYSGMAIDLWEEIAQRAGLGTRYQTYPTFRAMLDAVRDGRADVAVSNVTITRDRAATLSFTQPWYDAGLRIMVPTSRSSGFGAVFAGLARKGHLQVFAALAVIIVLATVMVTLFDRKYDEQFPKRWRDGIAESFFQVMSIATSGKSTRRNLFGWAGRIWSGIWLVAGVLLIAYITSSVTSVMTTLSLTRHVDSLADLPGKTIGVFEGSVAEEFARDLGLGMVVYDDTEGAVAGLKAGHIAAIIGDAPVLEYYAYTNPEEPVSVIGKIFHPDKYGFALPLDSALRRPLTVELLGLQESGRVEELRTEYFGKSP